MHNRRGQARPTTALATTAVPLDFGGGGEEEFGHYFRREKPFPTPLSFPRPRSGYSREEGQFSGRRRWWPPPPRSFPWMFWEWAERGSSSPSSSGKRVEEHCKQNGGRGSNKRPLGPGPLPLHLLLHAWRGRNTERGEGKGGGEKRDISSFPAARRPRPGPVRGGVCMLCHVFCVGGRVAD